MPAIPKLNSRAVQAAAFVLPAILASALLSGCVVAPLPGPVYADPGPMVVAPMAPPPPIAETVFVAPAPGYVWIGGYWSWNGGRHVWTRGHWEPPRHGQRWVPRRWEQGTGGWRQRGGHWERH